MQETDTVQENRKTNSSKVFIPQGHQRTFSVFKIFTIGKETDARQENL